MRKFYFCFLALLFLFSSCNSRKQSPANFTGVKPMVTEAEMEIPRKRGLTGPRVISAGRPEIVLAGKPVVTAANTNMKKAGRPVAIKALEPSVYIPGQDGVELPPVVPANDSTFIAGLPELITVRSPYSRIHNPFSFSFYTRLQGLRHDDISSLVQDQLGSIWISTYGGGVTRYDGKNFSHYTTRQGLGSNSIISSYVDHKGDVWLGTYGAGVYRFDGKNFTRFTLSENDDHNSVETIFQDRRGNYWFGTFGGGVTMYDGRNFTYYGTEQGLGHGVVYTISEDRRGNYWFGTRGGGVTKFDGLKFYQYTTRQGLSDDFILGSVMDNEGNLWFTTDQGGVSKFDGEYFYHYKEETGIGGNSILSVIQDSKGYLWFGNRRGGITRFDGETFERFTDKEGLINNTITYILEDNGGQLWFGSYGGGIARYHGNSFTHYSENNGLTNSFVRSVTEDRNGNLWFGTNGGGIFRYDGKNFYQYTQAQGLSGDLVRNIFEDRDGNLWIGTSGEGVSRFDGRNFYHYTERQGLGLDFIFNITQDRDGNMWFATAGGGATKFDGTEFTHFTMEQGLSDDNVRKIIQDQRGYMWFGTGGGGVSRYDGSGFLHLTEDQGLASNNILDLAEDKDGNIWIASNGSGLVRFDGKRMVHFTEQHGLGSDFVYSALNSREGDSWFGTRFGLSKLLPESLEGFLASANQNGSDQPFTFFKNYSYDDGFLGMGCNSRAAFEDSRGTIWFGANDILTAHHPSEELPGDGPPVMQLTGIGLFNEKVAWLDLINQKDTILTLSNGVEVSRFDFDGILPWYGIPNDLNLAHYNNYLTFHFVAIARNFSEKINYQYRLKGLEENWGPLVSSSEAHYGNLPSGNYTFMVRAINNEGVLSKTLSYSFSIRPPWWQSWIAYTFYIILAVLLVGLIFYLREMALRKKVRKQQKEVILRQEVEVAKKSAEFKQNFLANMSHEIRTPLTGILGMADIIKKTALDDSQREYLNTLIQSGENLRETINLVLDFSKIEAGKVKIRKQTFNYKELLDEAEKFFHSVCRKEIILEIYNDPNIPEYIQSDFSRVNQVLINLLSNAIKFTDKGKISISANLEPRADNPQELKAGDDLTIKILVSDTGKGISQEDQKHLFKPFFQAEQDYDRKFDGTGLGLSICRELVNMMEGKIGLESSPDKGSEFWFIFKATAAKGPGKNQRKEVHGDDTPQLNILLVEDKPINQRVISLMLQSMGHQVMTANNGAEALEAFYPDGYDLILMDIQMPVMDGITATQKLKTDYSNPPPIVGLSANAFEGDREKYMSMGMDEYLTKPVREKDFKMILQKLKLVE